MFLFSIIGDDWMAAHYTHIEDYIKTFYEKIGITKPQELKFQIIAERLGIQVFYWPEPSQALFNGQRGYICINESLTVQAQWQDFNHELAHLLLHTGRQRRLPESFRTYQESKANNFMYHACIPTFMLDEMDLFDVTASTVDIVQMIFNVERDFAVKRLTSYLTQKQSITFWNTLSQLNEIHI